MALQHALMVLLETEAGSGYDLMKGFKQRLGFFWHASHQQIYQQLKKMLDAGLITMSLEPQDGKPDRKVYALTSLGRMTLKQWIEDKTKLNTVNDALLVKLYAGHLVDEGTLLEEIRRHRALHENMLHTFAAMEAQYHALPAHEKKQYRLPYLTLRRGILDKQSWLQWADEVETELASSAK